MKKQEITIGLATLVSIVAIIISASLWIGDVKNKADKNEQLDVKQDVIQARTVKILDALEQRF